MWRPVFKSLLSRRTQAHAMTTHMASGSGQAFEVSLSQTPVIARHLSSSAHTAHRQDGLILATLLAQPETQPPLLGDALSIYDALRRPFSQHVQRLSFRLGEVYWLDTPRTARYPAGPGVDIALDDLHAVHAEIVDLHRWTWTTTLSADRERAVRMLGERAQGREQEQPEDTSGRQPASV